MNYMTILCSLSEKKESCAKQFKSENNINQSILPHLKSIDKKSEENQFSNLEVDLCPLSFASKLLKLQIAGSLKDSPK